MSTLHKKYINEIKPTLQKDLNIKNVMMIPCLEKVVINRGMGEAINNSKVIEETYNNLYLISGQKPVITYAKKSISNFKLRAGQAVGCKVTLRGKTMYEFLTKLFNLVIPRIRDFRGYPLNSFDDNGNYSFGILEDALFPEIDTDKVVNVRGLDITLCTNVSDKESAMHLLKALGFPFRKNTN